MNVRSRIEGSFARQGMMRTLGAALDHIGDGIVRVAAEVSDLSSQQLGAAHAGLTFSIADSAAGYAALTILPDGYEIVTSEFRISLLAPGRGRLVAEGRVIRPGRRLIAVAADVRDAEGAHVATGLGTMVPVKA